jgi:hypothetical protein
MALPVVGVEIDFSSGPSFGYPFILDNPNFGKLDVNILADGPLDLVDITDKVRRVSTRRGRNRILSQFEAGTATVTLNDPDSWFNPQNTSSPYYGKLLPLRKIRIYGTTQLGSQSVQVPIFSGYITSFDTSFYVGTNEDATVTLQCVDGFRLLTNVSTEIPPVPGCTTLQPSGVRVENLLSFGGFPTSMMELDVGDSIMQPDPGGNRSILAAIQTVEQSEFGAFVMTRQGKARFIDRTSVSLLADVPPLQYSDMTTGPTIYPYSNVDFAFDDQLILNDVSITRYAPEGTIPAPVPQIVTSQPSIDLYSYKSGQRTNLLITTDAEALDQAQTLVAARKNATLRIDSMSLNLNSDIDELNTLQNLSLDIYSLINIEKSMPGGSSVIRELFVQGVNHDISPGQWNIRVYTAEPIIQAFILDSATQGILGLTDPPNNNALTY